mmetsp:Transcript_118847/g.282018  ORF Transcript_118847/g.282018 Transcript_118847/m.282018 type:complete len:232 (+) Transcript_118847:521-1216(+)
MSCREGSGGEPPLRGPRQWGKNRKGKAPPSLTLGAVPPYCSSSWLASQSCLMLFAMSASATNSTFDFLSSGISEFTIARTIEGMWKIFVVKLRPQYTSSNKRVTFLQTVRKDDAAAIDRPQPAKSTISTQFSTRPGTIRYRTANSRMKRIILVARSASNLVIFSIRQIRTGRQDRSLPCQYIIPLFKSLSTDSSCTGIFCTRISKCVAIVLSALSTRSFDCCRIRRACKRT